MSRRHRAEKRQTVPDARYKSPLVAHLVNVIMKSGKKNLAQRIVYGAFEKVSEKLEKGDPVDLMLSALEHYDSSSMRVIGTLTGLHPKKDKAWEYHMQRYSLLDATQKTAIARFLAELPKLVELDSEGQKTVERALRNYWGDYLQSNATG